MIGGSGRRGWHKTDKTATDKTDKIFKTIKTDKSDKIIALGIIWLENGI